MAELKEAICSLDLTAPTGLRDRALLLLGFAGAFRRAEPVAQSVAAVELPRLALVIHLRRRKTNQCGEEGKAVFSAPGAGYCPVRAVQDWRAALDRPMGPLPTRMSRGASQRSAQPGAARLTDQSVNDLVRRPPG